MTPSEVLAQDQVSAYRSDGYLLLEHRIPRANDDVLAVGILLDDMHDDNGPLHDHHHNGFFVGAMDLATAGLDIDNTVKLTGPAGAISIHHARIVHGSGLNTSARDRRILFLEIMAADAFPIMGSMTRFDGIEDCGTHMLCGTPTIQPRLTPIPVRIPAPPPDRVGSIYETQGGPARSAFAKIKGE